MGVLLAAELPQAELVGGQSLVCLSYKRPDLFRRMAASIPENDEIIERVLINNGGDRETAAIGEEYGWTVLDPGRNLSFAAGCNVAVQETVSSHIVLINNDAVAETACLESLWARRSHPLVGCIIVDSTGKLNHAGGVLKLSGGGFAPQHLGRGQEPALVGGLDRFCPWATFACVQVARSLWDALGGLDEGFWYSFEDLDFCLRALEQTGTPTLIASDAVIRHDEFGTRDQAATDSRNSARFSQLWAESGRLERVLGLA